MADLETLIRQRAQPAGNSLEDLLRQRQQAPGAVKAYVPQAPPEEPGVLARSLDVARAGGRALQGMAQAAGAGFPTEAFTPAGRESLLPEAMRRREVGPQVPELIEEVLKARTEPTPGWSVAEAGARATAGAAMGAGSVAGAGVRAGLLALGLPIGGAMAGRAAAEAQGLDEESARTYEFVGELGGGLAPVAAAVSPFRAIYRHVRGMLTGEMSPAQRDQALQDIGNVIAGEAGEEGAARVSEATEELARALRRGDVGTTGMLTGSPELQGLERQLSRVTPEPFHAQREAAQEQVAERVRAVVPSGSSRDLPDLVRPAVQEVDELQRRMRQTAEAARPAEAGRKLQEAVETGYQQSREENLRLWALASDETTMPTADVKEAVRGVIRELPQWDRPRYIRALGQQLRDVFELPDEAPINEVNALRRRFSELIPSSTYARPPGEFTPDQRVITQLQDAMSGQIRQQPGAQALLEAQSDYALMKEIFGEGPLRKARRAGKEAPETIAARVAGRRGTTPQLMRQLDEANVYAPEAGIPGRVQEVLQAELLQAMRTKGGDLDAAAGRKWLTDRAETIDSVQRRALDRTVREVELANEQAQRLKEGPLRQLAEGVEPARVAKAVRTSLDGPQPMQGAQDILDAALSGARTPGERAAARASVQAAYRDALLPELITESGLLHKDALARLQSHTDTLRVVFPDVVVDNLLDTVQRGSRAFARGTPRIEPAGEAMRAGVGVRIQSLLGRLMGAAIGGQAANAPLIGAQIGSRTMVELIERMPQAKRREAVVRYLTQPERFMADLEKAGAENISPRDAFQILQALSQRYAPLLGAVAATQYAQE